MAGDHEIPRMWTPPIQIVVALQNSTLKPTDFKKLSGRLLLAMFQEKRNMLINVPPLHELRRS